MTDLNIWTYCNKEISELLPKFDQIFGIKLIRDYENIWEWIWNGSNANDKINISREHNMKTGEYDKPLRIVLSWKSEILNQEELIHKIQSILKTPLFIGEIINSGREKEEYVTKQIVDYEL